MEKKCEGLYLLMSKKFKLKRFYYAFSILQRFDPKPNKFKYCGLLQNSECERLQEKEVVHFETPELINFHTAVFVWFVMPLVTSSFITVLF